MPYTFLVSTTKGPQGSVTTLDETNFVSDLYSEVQKIINWSAEENDFYIIILSGKKLMDETVTLASLKPNPTKAQVVVTKLSKPSKRTTKESLAAAASVVVDTTMGDGARAGASPKESTSTPTPAVPTPASTTPTAQSTAPSSTTPGPKSDQVDSKLSDKSVETMSTTTTATPTSSSSLDSTAIAPKEDEPKTMANAEVAVPTESTPQPTTATTLSATTTTSPTSTSTETTASSSSSAPQTTTADESKSDSKSEPFDYSQTPKLNFIPLLAGEKNLGQFWEILEALNPEVAKQLNSDPLRFTQFMEITTRNDKTPAFDVKEYVEEAEKVMVGLKTNKSVAKAVPTAEERAAAAKAAQAQKELAQKRIESQLTEADQEHVNNLMALGFSKAKCVQAYILCDKNPELAANWLFGQMD